MIGARISDASITYMRRRLKAFGGHGRILSVMTPSPFAAAILTLALFSLPVSGGWTKETLPIEPDLATRIDEHYDHEARLFLMLYSLHGDGHVDDLFAPFTGRESGVHDRRERLTAQSPRSTSSRSAALMA